MKVNLLLNVYNEGADVLRTIQSFQRQRGDCELKTIVVDDGSTDGSCDALPDEVLVVKPESKVGIGRAKHILTRADIAEGDVLLHADGHNRLVRQTVADIAQLCIDNEPCIVTPAVGPLVCVKSKGCPRHATKECNVDCPEIEDNNNVPPNCYQGGVIALKDSGLYANGTVARPADAFQRTGVVNPSTFAYSRASLEHFGGWNIYPGWWGSQECGLSLRAWFSATPIYIARDIVVLHRYRSWNHPQGKAVAPYDIGAGHRSANHRYMHRVVFEDYDRLFGARFGKDETAEALVAESEVERQRLEFKKVKRRTDAEFFTEVLRRPYPVGWRTHATATRALYYIRAGLGNIVLCLPAIRAAAQLSGEPIDVLDAGAHQKEVRELLELQPFVRKVVDVEPPLDDYRYVLGSLWAKPPFFTPEGTKVGVAGDGWRTRHEVELNMEAARQVGFTGITPPAELLTWHTLAIDPPLPQDYVVIGVGAGGYQGKKWRHWSACAERLKAAGVSLVFLGAPSDDEAWMDGVGVNLCGATTLAQAAGVLWSARLYLGIDNGLSHLAAAVRTPSVVLYGWSAERKNRPWSLTCDVLRYDGFDCAPCWGGRGTCASEEMDRACIQALRPDYVADYVLESLNAPAWLRGSMTDLYLTRKQTVENMAVRVMQKHPEYIELCHLLRRFHIQRILEVGAGEGGWIGVMATTLPGLKHIIAIDPLEDAPPETVASAYKPEKAHQVLEWLESLGHTVRLNPSPIDGSVDLLHIDGDHAIGSVWRDWEQFKGVVRPGGLVVFHDVVSEAGPKMVFDSLVQRGGYQTWRFVDRTRPYGIGVLRIPPTDGRRS